MLVAAYDYLRRGWQPTPLKARTKQPRCRDWPSLRLSESELPQHFSDGDGIGLLLGDASRGLTDIDLDAPEAVALANEFLPATSRIHGRRSKPGSHRWYTCDPPPKPTKFSAPDGTCLLEVRASGQQTAAPPTVHPSNELYVWEQEGEPRSIDAAELRQGAAELAAASLAARVWPPPTTQRHDCSLALAGLLLRCGRDCEFTKHFIEAVARAAGDEEWLARGKNVATTAQKLAENCPATGGPTFASMVRDGDAVVSLLRKWLGLREPATAGRPGRSGPSQSDLVMTASSDVELFHAPGGNTYGTARVGDLVETWPLRSSAFRQFLTRRFYESHRTAPSTQALEDSLRLLEAKALFDSAQYPVFVRLGAVGEAFFLDLANEAREVVEIRRDGWRIVRESAARFIRPRGTLPLPQPVRGGSVNELRPLVNVASECEWRLLVGVLVAALQPCGPYPVLLIHGEQGSCKTTLARVVRELVDPNIAPTRSFPRTVQDVAIAAKNSWVLSFDNLSHLPPWFSDLVCCLSTGGGFSTRELYTDTNESLFDFQRPVVLNGIEEIVTRGDLLDRCVALNLPSLADQQRRSEAHFRTAFESVRPRVLGALLDAVSGSIRNREGVKLDRLPRLADFAVNVTAAEEVLGWESGAFISAYNVNRNSSHDTVLETSAIAGPLRKLVCDEGNLVLTAGELLVLLNDHASESRRKRQDWPESPKQLANALRRIGPTLRSVGIDVRHGERAPGGSRRRLIRIVRSDANDGPGGPDGPDGPESSNGSDAHAVDLNKEQTVCREEQE